MLTGFRKIEIFIFFMSEVSGTLLQKVLRDPDTFQSSEDVAFVLVFQDGKWSSSYYSQGPWTMEKMTKVRAILYFKEVFQKPRSTRHFQLDFINLNSSHSVTQLNKRAGQSSFTSNQYRYSGKSQTFYYGRKRGL